MKRILIGIGLLLMMSLGCFGQQLPQFSQYMFNYFVLNPAVAGTKNYAQFRADSRDQWVGMEGHPRTQTLSFNMPMMGGRLGGGGFFFNDRIGPVSRTGLSLAYAYHMTINKKSALSFGLSGSYYSMVLRTEELKFEDGLNAAADNALTANNLKGFYPNFGSGLYYFHERYYAGFSVPELVKIKVKSNDFFAITQDRHYYLLGGYLLKLREGYTVEPSFLIKYVKGAPLSVDLNAIFQFYGKFNAGMSYRYRDALVFLIGYNFERVHVAYSYDLTTTRLRNYNMGTHEVSIGLDIGKVRKSVCDAYGAGYQRY